MDIPSTPDDAKLFGTINKQQLTAINAPKKHDNNSDLQLLKIEYFV